VRVREGLSAVRRRISEDARLVLPKLAIQSCWICGSVARALDEVCFAGRTAGPVYRNRPELVRAG